MTRWPCRDKLEDKRREEWIEWIDRISFIVENSIKIQQKQSGRATLPHSILSISIKCWETGFWKEHPLTLIFFLKKALNCIYSSCFIKAAFLQATEMCIIRTGLLIKPDIRKLEEDEPEDYVLTVLLLKKIDKPIKLKRLFLLGDTWEHGEWFLPSPGVGTCLPAVAPPDTHSLPVVCCAAYTPVLPGSRPWRPCRWPTHITWSLFPPHHVTQALLLIHPLLLHVPRLPQQLFTSRMRSPDCRRPSLTAAPRGRMFLTRMGPGPWTVESLVTTVKPRPSDPTHGSVNKGETQLLGTIFQ